jgi:uncharacterized protein YukE
MTTAVSTTKTNQNTGQLLADLTATTKAVQNKDWLSAGLDGASVGVDVLGMTGSPLSAVAQAGFGFVMSLVQFLEEPLHQLSGNPKSVTSSSQSLQGAGQDVSSLAGNYQQSATNDTTGWSGSAASAYRSNSAQQSQGIDALGKAGTAVAGAMSGAGEVVAQVTQAVTQLITEAAGKIITVLTQAFASAAATFGASVAAAIPQVVQIAADYGQRIAAKMATLLSSAQNLMTLITSVTQAVEAVTQVLMQLTANAQNSGSTSSDTTSTSTPTTQEVASSAGA